MRWGLDFRSRAVGFHADCIQCVEESARGVVRREEVRREMVSGAGHDSVSGEWEGRGVREWMGCVWAGVADVSLVLR